MDQVAYFEVCQKMCSTLSRKEIEGMAQGALEPFFRLGNGMMPRNINLLTCSKLIEQFPSLNNVTEHIDSIVCTTNTEKIYDIEIESIKTKKFFVYTLSLETAATETMQHDSEELSVASHIILPAVELQGLWESLYYDTDIKNNLLNFIETTLMFSDRKVDQNIISWNKVILLHGPPGTGKTSLCKALAQKAAIRLGHRYSRVQLVEINSHSLFSKWFSESGKLVMKLFDEIRRLLEDPEALICVLIDEVESLAHARKSCVNGNEPSDAIRVVNALLSQLDQIKRYPNAMVLTTSNVTEAIDLAFVDRADIKQYIGLPGVDGIYKIYMTCLNELMKTKFVTKTPICGIEKLRGRDALDDQGLKNSLLLLELSKSSIGLSGRTLRKIPFLAHAIHIQASECSLKDFLEAMSLTVEKHKNDDFSRIAEN